MSIPLTGKTRIATSALSRGVQLCLLGILGVALASAIRPLLSPTVPVTAGQFALAARSEMAVRQTGGSANAEGSSSRARIAPGCRPDLASPCGRDTKTDSELDTAAGVEAAPAALLENQKSPIREALRTVAECQSRYAAVRDYTCMFSKRERIEGELTPPHLLAMKVRTQPRSIYVKFHQPRPGREAIYIAGRNGGKVLAHDVGLNRLLAGTLWLEPNGKLAMEECRHPITEAGIGPLLETLAARWSAELDPSESVVTLRHDQVLGQKRCTVIETTHPKRGPGFMFYRVRVYVDREIGLPIRFEAYDWPGSASEVPPLAEEYAYIDLKLNVGLHDSDFDVSNTEYQFGRF
jgi:hypothetical protein